MEMILARLRWIVLAWLPRIGWLGGFGLLLLVVAAVTGLAAYRETGELAEQTSAVASRPSREDQRRLEDARSPQTQIAHFHAFLPTPGQIPQVISVIEREARDNGIKLDEGQFKLDAQTGERVARYEMVFPVKAEYGAMRSFLREALHATPALGLEQVSFRRDDPNNVVLESRVQFALYVLLPDPNPQP